MTRRFDETYRAVHKMLGATTGGHYRLDVNERLRTATIYEVRSYGYHRGFLMIRADGSLKWI